MSEELTLEQKVAQTKAKYHSSWWESSDDKILAENQLKEDVLIIDFSRFRKAVENVLGRPVYTHEFARPQRLIDEMSGKREAPGLSDILGLIDDIREGNNETKI